MLLQVQSLNKTYTRGNQIVRALKDVSLELKAGQFVSIMGPSGSGKSTLLHLMGGLDRPTSGCVILNGDAIERMNDDELSLFRRKRLGFIFQFFNLLPTLSALENVALPRLLDGEPLKNIEPKARELLEMIGMGKRTDHKPDQLSGGEMQRVAIARALIADPLLILADEPTGNLDSKNGEAVMHLLNDLHREGSTICMVTHDPRFAKHADREVHLFDGKVVSEQELTKLTEEVEA